MMRLMDVLGIAGCKRESAERYHIEIEAARIAYSVRDCFVSDPVTMTTTPSDLLSESYIAALAGLFRPKCRNPEVILPPLPGSNTIYLSVVDRDRRAVSFINSVCDGFGSRISTPKSGFALQNRGACFSLEPGHPNEIGPLKRPMHTIIPAIAMQGGRASISFGVVGGAFQPVDRHTSYPT
ncbi:Gamma-glutamyltranspeptidase [Mesorhizobium sp. NFR06]|uniref:gamma-glutamyltransferase n=1 Tax=Mesorhizobium sp. NFR06 TaxID=1566290 RepID=UPI0008E43558|nr:gamma-glutamyltransferase [Mesorhizobium sp. NFR06]SFQ13578.1 Gamma-glutamyltranspeptidase [Mesorhizobium sp. NFR06]